jgi:pyruvate/2-oxoglutarate dehydrogenase complex dihydrolipoamide dehydrogenase (E3) component
MTDDELRDSYDVIVLGLGPGGGEVAERLAEAGLSVLGIDPSLVGGECPYFGCIPSKMIVRAAAVLAEGRRVNQLAGRAVIEPDYTPVADRIRDEATDDWNDQVAVDRLRGLGGHFLRGRAQLAGRDADGHAVVKVGERSFIARRAAVLATGTAPAMPPIPGLADVAYAPGPGLSPDGLVWTNREVMRIRALPASLIVIGGGAVGVELAQAFTRFGVAVTILEGGPRILAPEEPAAAELLTEVLTREGATVRTGVSVAGVGLAEPGRADGPVRVTLADGTTYDAERILVAAGRRSHLPELGLETVGLDPIVRTVEVDEHMQVDAGLFAVGDVTGRGAFTHVAVWQARVLVAHLLDRPEPYGGYHGLAWITFTDPEIGRVGLSEQQARDQGLSVRTASTAIADSTRGWINGPGNDGFVKLVADQDRGVLVGATVAAATGGEILGLLTLAVHAQVPLSTLASMHYAYPSLHRAVLTAVRELV